MKRVAMRKIREILRLRDQGLNMREIGGSVGVGSSSVSDCLRRARDAGLSWPLPEDLTDAVLETRLYPRPPEDASTTYAKPDWPLVHRELRRPDVTRRLVWEEYRVAHSGSPG